LVTGISEQFDQFSQKQNDRYVSDYGEKAIKVASRFENKQRKDRASHDITAKIKEELVSELSIDTQKYNEILTAFNAMICKSEEPIAHMSEDNAVVELTNRNWFNKELDKEFQCIYFPENKAWISKNKNGYHRYFSKNKRTSEWFCLSIIDMFAILYGHTYKDALKAALKFFNISYLNDENEENWRRKQRKKYLQNIEKIENSHVTINSYYNLNRLISKHLHILLKMNNIGQAKVGSMYDNYRFDAVFFASSSYVADFFEVNKGTVNKIINMLVVLGLLTRVPETELSVPMKNKATEEMKKNNKQYLVTFYTVPHYTDEILGEANRIAGILLQNKVNASNITIEKIENILGSDEADRVYSNTRIHAKAISKKAKKNADKIVAKEVAVNEVIEEICDGIPF